MDILKRTFDYSALTTFLEPYTTQKARKSAVDALEKSGRLNAQAYHYLFELVEKNRPDLPLEYSPPHSKVLPSRELAKQSRIFRGREKLLIRLARIEKALDNKLKRIAKKQEQELRVTRSLGGRTLSQTFNRRR